MPSDKFISVHCCMSLFTRWSSFLLCLLQHLTETILKPHYEEHVKLCCYYAVFQQDPGCWRSRVCAMPCCSIFSGIRGFSFQSQQSTQWPLRSPPPPLLLLLCLLFHTLRWTMFFLPFHRIVTSLIAFHGLYSDITVTEYIFLHE